jgi:anti-sigma regulatory factor (Ser/Thr protein kinase)
MIVLSAGLHDGAAVVEAYGRLDLSTYADFRDRLLKIAAEEPTALIVHLTDDFNVTSTAELSVFTTVWMRVSEWPGVPVMVVAGDHHHRKALAVTGVTRFVPHFPSVREALDAVGKPRARRRHEVVLPRSTSSPRLARAFVRDTCARWNLLPLVDDAVLVVSELVENSVRHAGSGAMLRLELRTGQFVIAVHDEDADPPELRPLTLDQPGGRGLPLVEALSRAWGTSPHPGGGKVIWAVLAISDEPADGE